MNPHGITHQFEAEVAKYAGAKLCVATTSCTMALLLALAWWKHKHGQTRILLPSRTYVGVAQSVLNAGHTLEFEDYSWEGSYELLPTSIVDSARYFTADMHRPGKLTCCSFHWTKSLATGQGGCVLTDDLESYSYMRRARFDGRAEGVDPKDDTFIRGWHATMMPRDAAEGLTRLATLPRHNAPIPCDDYPPLDTMEIFKDGP